MKAIAESRWLCVLLFCAPLACGSKSSDAASSAQPSNQPARRSSAASSAQPSSSASASPVDKPYSAAPDAQGPALLGVTGGGFYMLEAGTLTKVSDDYVRHAEQASDGTVYFDATLGIKSLKSGPKVAEFADSSGDFSVAPDGSLWRFVGYKKEIGKLGPDGKTWSEEAVPVGADETLMYFGAAAKDTVVVTTQKKIFVKRGAKWETIEISKLFPGDSVYINGVARYEGELYILTSDGAATLDGKKLPLPKGEYGFLSLDSASSLSASGDLALRSSDTAIVVSKGKAETIKAAQLGLAKAEFVRSFAVDGQGRRWVSTNAGLAILGPDNKPLQTWPVGSLPGPVQFIYVIGAGPALGEVAPVVKGNVKGRMTLNGEPIKNAEIVACDSPSSLITGSTPCSADPVELKAKTDESGVFHLVDVPRWNYGFAFKDDRGWSVTLGFGSSCCMKVNPQSEIDIGDIAIKDSK